MKVWILTESQLDFEDYPIGSTRIIAVTSSDDRAKAWRASGRPRLGRSAQEMEVEDA